MEKQTPRPKILSRDQARALLLALGIEFTETDRWLLSTCPVHHGDNRTALNFDIDHGTWCCRTHHCEHEYGRDVAGLVAGVKSIPPEDAGDWISENVDEDMMVEAIEREEREEIFPEFCLRSLQATKFYRERGFTEETLKCFEHGLAESKKLHTRVVFAVRNSEGKIVGFSGRWAGKETVVNGRAICVNSNGREVPKWLHHSFKKSRYLYHFTEAKEFSKKNIIVVESIGNVMRFWEAGYKNCVACMGSSISSDQSKILTSCTDCIILAFDNDAAGHKAARISKRRMEHFVDIKVMFPPDQRDWAEMSTEEVKHYAQSFCQQA